MILEAATAHEVLAQLKDIDTKTITFIDVDDTLITPRSTTFRAAPYNKLIDEIKTNKHLYANYEKIVSNWRLQRQVMLLDEAWPEVLGELKDKFVVFALTKMDIGMFGNISSMEEWRYNELSSLGLFFTDEYDLPPTSPNRTAYHKGIFFAGDNSKSQTIADYLPYLGGVNHIALIDDRIEHLLDVENFCQEQQLDFTGILFKGLDKLTDMPNPEIAKFQRQYLLEKTQWLEDDEVAALVE
jgi:hypothetical protein